MSIHRHSKEKYGKSSGHSRFDPTEESAARTRPFSFGDIMLRRKNKGLTENIEHGAAELGTMPKELRVVDVPDRYIAEGSHRRLESSSLDLKNLLITGSVKASSRRKEEHNSLKDETVITRRDGERESFPSSMPLKVKQTKNIIEKDRRKTDQLTRELRKNDKRSREDTENRTEKKRRDRPHSDKHGDQKREKHVDSKRKYQNDEDGKGRHKNDGKRREHSKHRSEESRLKERQSRSRDDKNNSKSLVTISPKSHKHTSKMQGEHQDLALNSHEDKSGPRHSDVDRSIISTNGSSSYRRHGGSTSRLGGYSPRKRRVDNSIKTSPPPHRSPDKKSARWDLPPAGKDSVSSGSVLSFPQSVNIVPSSDTSNIYTAAPSASTSTKSIMTVSTSPSAMKGNASIDLIQLTQATRPMRRLYIENVPSTATEKALMECLNNFLLSSGVNQIAETQTCISCNLHKEKGIALVEFLTSEDASAALSFDGVCFTDSILKIRRPKDFFELATGELEKSVAVDTISEVVEDSPNKIFVGGISKELSPKMLKEIFTAFGALKSYHFVINEHLNQPSAFLEYADLSVTLKACAGLNGMKVGGQVLTVVQACPFAFPLEHSSYPPCYDIPDHAKPLLEPPTTILKLKNMFDPAQLLTQTEVEVEEVLEDIRLEFARFGVVKSVSNVKLNHSSVVAREATEPDFRCEDKRPEADNSEQDVEQTREVGETEFSLNVEEVKVATGEAANGDVAFDDRGSENELTENPSDFCGKKVTEITQKDEKCSENKSPPEDTVADKEEQVRGCEEDMEEEVFEPGSIFVEYNRTEASCAAAHCLHGRVFDGRIVTVEYVRRDKYRARFRK